MMKPTFVSGCFLRLIADFQIGLANTTTGRRISTSSDDYQYLHKSALPTMHFQLSLPQLPIPPLDRTLQRYLAAQRPLLTDEQFKSTEDIVKKFQEKEGKALHGQLVALEKQKKHTSYVAEAWLNMYLTSREPTSNINGSMLLADDPKIGYNTQLTRASNIVISVLRFMHTLRDNFLEPEVQCASSYDTKMFQQVMRLIPSQFSCQFAKHFFKVVPKDMSQYQWQFGSIRMPHKGRDKLLSDEKACHVMVIRNGNIYIFDVLDYKGFIKDPSYIHGCLHQVLADSRPKAEFPIAAVTTMDRDLAAQVQQQLINAGNAEALHLVATAIFSIHLDDVVVAEDEELLVQRLNPGDGSNSWFDKGIEFKIAKDGKTAAHSEHSRIDGITNLRLLNEVMKDSITRPFIHPHSQPANVDSSAVKCLDFKYVPCLMDEIQNALEKHREATMDKQFKIFRYDKFGKKFIKEQKLSPDAIVQLAFQMGYHRLSGKTVATYESCSTASFRHGRTETIRSATVATKKCSEKFAKKSAEELRSLIATCSNVHQVLARDAASGHGFDRHLFMLRVLAEAEGCRQLQAVFSDPAYKAINHNILSTSCLGSDAVKLLWFSPVVKDGLGIGYSVNSDSLRAMIVSHLGHSNADGFSECLHSSLDDILEVLLRTSS